MKQLNTADRDFWRYSALKHVTPWYRTLSSSPLADRVSDEFKELFDVDTMPPKVYSRVEANLNYSL